MVIDLDGKSGERSAPRRVAADTGPIEEAPIEGAPRRRWVKPAVITLVVLALVAGGGYFLIQYLRTNYWYVGTNDAGAVTIFQGRAEDLFGFDLDEAVEVTDLVLADLPEHLRDNVEEGRTADSRAEAEQIVSDLQQRARELEQIRSQDEKPSDGANAPGDDGNTGGGAEPAPGNDGKNN